jgi:hypothetical protein
MSLASAFSSRAATLVEAQNTYKQNVVVVNTFVNSAFSSNLPTLNSQPPCWSEFTATYSNGRAAANQWVNDVLWRLLSVPSEVQNYNGDIAADLQAAAQAAAALEQNPNDQDSLDLLNQSLGGVESRVNLVVKFIGNAVQAIEGFENQIPTIADDLQSLAAQSAQIAQADQQAIQQLSAQVQQLQADINANAQSIVALGIVDVAAITLGVVVTFAAWPAGAVVWFALGPVVAAATTELALDASNIVHDKQQITAIQGQMSGLTADVATLQVLADGFTSMSAQIDTVQQALTALLAEWQTLATDVSTALTDVQTALTDASASNFQAVASDISEASDQWTAAYGQAGSLVIQLTVNPAPLTVGMALAEVQTALAAAVPVDIVDYYNSVA